MAFREPEFTYGHIHIYIIKNQPFNKPAVAVHDAKIARYRSKQIYLGYLCLEWNLALFKPLYASKSNPLLLLNSSLLALLSRSIENTWTRGPLIYPMIKQFQALLQFLGECRDVNRTYTSDTTWKSILLWMDSLFHVAF